ncbi:reverse transcriptase domain-containing protein [Tanacetum coccineum]|uniref:Reverse transcriptase domain-containing protein n=1 Tax=Tanacetum coccineum TaxID=301880 RepID=A0ABQ5I8H1_9ASTR
MLKQPPLNKTGSHPPTHLPQNPDKNIPSLIPPVSKPKSPLKRQTGRIVTHATSANSKNMHIPRCDKDISMLMLSHFSLKGKAAEWLDRIPSAQITTWDQLVSRFLDHFFLVGRTSSLRDLILRFKHGDQKRLDPFLRLNQRGSPLRDTEMASGTNLSRHINSGITIETRSRLVQFFRLNSRHQKDGWNRIERCQYQKQNVLLGLTFTNHEWFSYHFQKQSNHTQLTSKKC